MSFRNQLPPKQILLFLLFMVVFASLYYSAFVLNSTFDRYHITYHNASNENATVDKIIQDNKILQKQVPPDSIKSTNSLENDELCQSVIDGTYNRESYRKVPDQTSDEDVFKIAQRGCGALQKHYSFPVEKWATRLELENPIAFSLLVHKDINQVLLLLSALYSTQNVYCIHVDLTSPDVFLRAIKLVALCFPNVFLSKKREDVIYATFSRLQADLYCMEDLVNLPTTVYNWSYLINLCGQDFPLKTNQEMMKQLVTLKGKSVINGDYNPKQPNILGRTKFIHKIVNETVDGGGLTRKKLLKTSQQKNPPPYKIPLRKNLAYNIYFRPFLRWVLFESEKAKALLEWSRDTATPDEHYWLMLASLPEAPGGVYKGNAMASHYIMFNSLNRPCKGYWSHYSCVFGVGDLAKMLHKQKKFFANKFDSTYDSRPVKCLRKWLEANENKFNNNTLFTLL